MDLALAVPLVPLRELAAHEQQLLAGVGVLVQIEQAQARELLPLVAGQLADHRALSVHHLVVREGQHEVFGKCVEQPERQQVVVVVTVDRVLGEVREGVVHPPHVPLHAEPEAAEPGRPRDLRPGGGLLGDHDGPGELVVDDLVELAQAGHGLEVLAPAVLVRQPVALGARVVEVEHRSDGVDPQPVDVELVQPVHGARQQEVADLVAAVVEDQRAPVAVLAAARVLVFEQRGTVEACQGVLVPREVRRDPVDQHPDAALVEMVDEVPEVVRSAEAARRRVVACGLVAPGDVQRVLGDGQQLDVRVAEVGGVVGQPVRELAVVDEQPAVPDPGAQVHLVDRHRCALPVVVAALRHPIAVLPGVGGRALDDARGLRALLEAVGVGIRLEHDVAGLAAYLELVEMPRGESRDEELPDAGATARPHGVHAAVPAVEIPDDADAHCVRRPDREQGARDLVDRVKVRTEEPVGVPVPALAEQVQIEVAELRREGIGVVGRQCVAVLVVPAEAVVRGDLAAVAAPLEEVRVGDALERDPALLDRDRACVGEEGPHEHAVVGRVATEHGEGIVVARLGDASQRFRERGGRARLGARHGAIHRVPKGVAGAPRRHCVSALDGTIGRSDSAGHRRASRP